ncbi:MAG TPA: membrane dipeptidase [Candidatus Paceibacterota bacterium]|nr:membrane dipeptidase [Candidatus Paceibacterota bacterium]
MRYADSLGFLFSQKELMSHDPLTAANHNVPLELCHVTVAPPIPPMKKMENLGKELVWFLGVIAHEKYIRMVHSADDVAQPGLKIIGGLQQPPEDATLEQLEFLRRLGVLFMGLAYQDENSFGGGFLAPDASLTEHGRMFMIMLAKAGMVLDLSHAGERTAREALDFVEQMTRNGLDLNVVATHSGCKAVYPHERNLPDDTIKRIAGLGGFVGIPTLTFILDENDDSLAPFLRHFMHAKELVGAEHLTIGTDGVYKTLDREEQQAIFNTMKSKLDPDGKIGARFPDQPAELNSESKMGWIANELYEHGLDSASVAWVTGENLIEFVTEAL